MQLLVVEDEYWIRKGILQAIDWETLHMQPAGEARNGVEALALLDRQPVDVIITDMKMPAMGGDQLLAELMRRDYRGGLVVLSEYADYAYMRQAIHAQVDEYMLKPIDEKELNSVLLRVRDRLLTQTGKAEPLGAVLAALAAGETPPAVPNPEAAVTLAVIWAEHLADIPFGHEDVKGGALYWHTLDTHEGLLLLTGDAGGTGSPLVWEAARTQWQNAGGGEVWLSLSDWTCAAHALQALEQARQAACFWRRGLGVVPYAQTRRCEKTEPEALMDARALGLLLQHGQPNDADALAQRLAAHWEHQAWVYLPALRNALVTFSLLVQHACRERNAVGPDTPSMAIQSVRCPQHARVCLREMLAQAFAAVTATRFTSGEDVVEQMLAYLRTHYADEVNLLGLADQYHMNYIYVSRLFKKRTGVNFTDYLLRLRMEEARRLLRQGALRVKDVAAMVGYPNPYYFSASYQRFYGHSPTNENYPTDAQQPDRGNVNEP